MVTQAEVEKIVRELFDAFPSLDRWFNRLSEEQRKGIRNSWFKQLGTLEQSDVRAAANRILSGEVELPANYEFDRLGVVLRSWGSVASQERIAERDRQKYRKQAQKQSSDTSARAIDHRFGPAIKCASAWGQALRSQHVTESQNENAMRTIHRYHRHGDVELAWPDVPQGERKSIVDFWKSGNGKL